MSGITTSEVCRMTGVTPRQLQWWDENGIVIAVRKPPCRAGRIAKNRVYGPIQVRQVQVLARLAQIQFLRRGHNRRVHPSRVRMPLSALRCRYMLFGACGVLLAASDDPAEIIRQAAIGDRSGFALVDMGVSMPDSDSETPGQD